MRRGLIESTPMKINPEWASIVAFFAVSAVLALIHIAAFVAALPSKGLYWAARPLQRLLDRLSGK